jgi:hypothetical protein
MRFSIPVVHLRDHQEDCEYMYGSYYLTGGSRFYGEQAESIWAEFNQLGSRTRQMSSGHRHDVINEHLDDWNWRKICGLGKGSPLGNEVFPDRDAMDSTATG